MIELRRQAEEEPEQLPPLRRGWALGSTGFREAMLERVGAKGSRTLRKANAGRKEPKKGVAKCSRKN